MGFASLYPSYVLVTRGIHVLGCTTWRRKTWMARSSPAMMTR